MQPRIALVSRLAITLMAVPPNAVNAIMGLHKRQKVQCSEIRPQGAAPQFWTKSDSRGGAAGPTILPRTWVGDFHATDGGGEGFLLRSRAASAHQRQKLTRGTYRRKRDVSNGSTTVVLASKCHFLSTPINRLRQTGPAGLKRCQQRTSLASQNQKDHVDRALIIQ